ncbi:unnamed protein product [Schistosoma margrebowiei]|uniref:Uncharacterized protein n=1 Tax=Schistosoma margrebowiei TaxID=48269 RepID=A0A183MJ43_9TREM|nr:unnamed protein product [Schistosoma margrebowiei]
MIPSLTRSTERRKHYYVWQMERNQRSTNFNASGDAGTQELSSQGMDPYRIT